MPQVHLSDKVIAIQALAAEIDGIEQNQILSAREMSILISRQIEFSKRLKALTDAMQKLIQ